MDTPSARIIATAQAIHEVTDGLGRRLALRQLGALDRLRLFKAAGAVLASNPGWMGLATLVFSVTAIDDVPVPQPSSEAQIEALVGRLGDPGLSAVSAAIASGATAFLADAKN